MQVRIDYTIESISPFHIGAGYSKGKLVSRVAMTNSEGMLYIPGSTIKGKLRDIFAHLYWSLENKRCKRNCLGDCLCCGLFGSREKVGRIHFGDAVLADGYEDLKEIQYAYYSRIRMHRSWRKAMEKSLNTTELGRQGLNFTGVVNGELNCLAGELPRELLLLVFAFRLMGQVGSGHSLGRGSIKVSVDQVLMDDLPLALHEIMLRLDKLYGMGVKPDEANKSL